MKITQKQINQAYSSLMYLSGLKLPIKTAFGLHKIVNVFKDGLNFGAERETALIEHYKGTINPDGTITFDSEENKKDFIEEIEELYAYEHDVDIDKVTIDINMISEQKISVTDIDNLEGIVDFK